jgi:hypothetical protein
MSRGRGRAPPPDSGAGARVPVASGNVLVSLGRRPPVGALAAKVRVAGKPASWQAREARGRCCPWRPVRTARLSGKVAISPTEITHILGTQGLTTVGEFATGPFQSGKLAPNRPPPFLQRPPAIWQERTPVGWKVCFLPGQTAKAPREGPANWQTPLSSQRESPIFTAVDAPQGGLPVLHRSGRPPCPPPGEGPARPLDAPSPLPRTRKDN